MKVPLRIATAKTDMNMGPHTSAGNGKCTSWVFCTIPRRFCSLSWAMEACLWVTSGVRISSLRYYYMWQEGYLTETRLSLSQFSPWDTAFYKNLWSTKVLVFALMSCQNVLWPIITNCLEFVSVIFFVTSVDLKADVKINIIYFLNFSLPFVPFFYIRLMWNSPPGLGPHPGHFRTGWW